MTNAIWRVGDAFLAMGCEHHGADLQPVYILLGPAAQWTSVNSCGKCTAPARSQSSVFLTESNTLYSQDWKLFLQFPWILTVPYILYIFIYQKLWHCPRKLWGKFCVIFLSLLLAYCISIWVGILSPESTPGPSAHALYSFCKEIKLHWFWHAHHYRSNHSGLYLLILEEPQSFIFNVVALKSWGNSPGWWIAL